MGPANFQVEGTQPRVDMTHCALKFSPATSSLTFASGFPKAKLPVEF